MLFFVHFSSFPRLVDRPTFFVNLNSILLSR
nr:MAG TPA: hypothetical protein [Caudoviricetes sp.]